MLYQVNNTRVLYILDANTGEGLGADMVQYPGAAGNRDWLVIGNDERLALLNSNGYLKIYKETWEDLPINIDAEPERFRLESFQKIKEDDQG